MRYFKLHTIPLAVLTACIWLCVAPCERQARAEAPLAVSETPIQERLELSFGVGEELSAVWQVGGEQSPSVGSIEASYGSPRGGFSMPRAISEPDDQVGSTELVSDAAGNQLAVWSAERVYDPQATCGKYMEECPFYLSRGVWYAWRRAGQPFSPAKPVAPPSANGDFGGAINQRGEAVVAYQTRSGVYIRRGSANRGLGAPMRIARFPETDQLEYAGIDSDGEVLVLTASRNAIQAVQDAHGKRPRPPWTHSFKPETSIRYLMGYIGSGGRAVIAGDVLFPTCEECAVAAYQPPQGRFGKVHRFREGTEPELVNLQRNGGGLLIVSSPFSDVEAAMKQVLRAVRISTAGSFSKPVELGLQGAFNSRAYDSKTSQMAADEDGDTIIAGVRREGDFANPRARRATLRTYESSGGAAFGRPTVLSTGLVTKTWPDTFVALPAVAVAVGHRYASAWVPPEAPATLLVQESNPLSAGPVAQIALPTDAASKPGFLPASVLYLHEAVRLDQHGEFAADLRCGSEGEEACVVEVLVELDGPGNDVLGGTTVRRSATSDLHLNIPLDQTARKLLASEHRLSVTVKTLTQQPQGPPLESAYPLVLEG